MKILTDLEKPIIRWRAWESIENLNPMRHLWLGSDLGTSKWRPPFTTIQATITNYDIVWMHIDSGNFINMLFKGAFDPIHIGQVELWSATTSLFSFLGQVVKSLGQISLSLSLREEPCKRTMTLFTIMDTLSLQYNVILGYPALSTFMLVVPLYYH